ncbi:cGMP-dependent 3',5'-cyclic phosphodiesterase-like isoform X2 [Haliotis asinina]|uniref:cGMP-dependent 3',5'-cyclic phosphodiesterase-like isoform X2 n=1 Tax=Haliotis asinina TaxID=109174 RepID=UPI00353249AC
MVIVITHALASAYLFSKDPDKFMKNKSQESESSKPDAKAVPSECTGNVYIQEAFLPLLEAKTVAELRTAIRKALTFILPQVTKANVYLRSPETTRVETNGRKSLPAKGLAWKAYQQRQQLVQPISSPQDPVITALALDEDIQQSQLVLCLPIQDREDNENIGLIVASLPPGKNSCSATEEGNLTYLAKQVSVCYHLTKNSVTRRKSICADDTHFEALINLCGELYDHDAASLQLKVIKYLEQRTQAQTAFLLIVVKETNELFCQVVGNTILAEEVRFPGETSSFAVALQTKEPICLEDIPQDRRAGLEDHIGSKLESFLCVPVRRKNCDDLIALACVANKKGTIGFTSEDVYAIHQCFQYTATVLTSTLAFQNERKLKIQTQALLHIAKNLFTHLDDLTKLLREIMQEARNLTHAERCSVFLIDPETDELVAKVFDGISANDKEVQQEIRMPKTQGIAGHVATTGNLLNIPDAYSHPLFYRGIDDSTGFKTRNILCFPIKDEEEKVLGVAQLCNKKTGPYFTVFDEDIASAFAVYCCISISHSLMYNKVIDAQYRNSLANELMMFHMKVTTDEVRDLISSDMLSVHGISPIFDKFHYAPRTIPEADTPVACLSMFEDLGLITKFRIKKDTLARFVLMVKRGYRNPPYHNWMHAYAVAHFCYLLVKNLHLEKHLKDIEVFALFVACLCHDIDHRGTTNSFQVQSESVLAALYSSEGSVMERHHFAQSMCIVNTEGCNIFEHLSSSDYQHVLDLMRDIILATDLAHHLRIFGGLEKMAENGYDSTQPDQRNMLLCLLMTSCDLSDQTKDWNNTKHIAAQVYQEFFSQGDLEKAVGKDPIEMMDREKACIPDLQINFLDGIALPVYRILEKLFPECKEVHEAVEKNKLKWVRIGQLLKMRRGTSTQGLSMEQILTLEDDEEEVNEQHNGR